MKKTGEAPPRLLYLYWGSVTHRVKAFEKKTFSTHVRWCERGAPVQVTQICLRYEAVAHHPQGNGTGAPGSVSAHAPSESSLTQKKTAHICHRHAWQIWALRHFTSRVLLSNRSQEALPKKSRTSLPFPVWREVKMLREVVNRLRPSHHGSASGWPRRPARPTWTSLPSERRSVLRPSWPSWADS
jgi:hypothetical protein